MCAGCLPGTRDQCTWFANGVVSFVIIIIIVHAVVGGTRIGDLVIGGGGG